MKQLLFFCIIFLFAGCSNQITKENLSNLNGYWEINEVIFSNGKRKKFKASTTIDFIKTDSLKGFRKKMQPKFKGSFTTSNDAELFTIVEKDGAFNFLYKNGLSEWSEKIVTLSQNSFSVVNKDTITYVYKRFTPINLKE